MGFHSSGVGEWFTASVRRIARSAECQERYAACDGDGCRFFGASNGYELNDAQLALAKWIRIYKAVLEMPPHERPDDTIVNDDAKFDKWCDRFTREQAQRLAKLDSGQPGLTEDEKRQAMPMFGS